MGVVVVVAGGWCLVALGVLGADCGLAVCGGSMGVGVGVCGCWRRGGVMAVWWSGWGAVGYSGIGGNLADFRGRCGVRVFFVMCGVVWVG